MPNPLFNRFGGNNQNASNPLSNMSNMINNFRQFRSQFQGDPRAQVQQLLDSGQMTQEQFNQLSNMATQLQNMFK